MARTRYVALLTCATLLFSPATAVAGPDDGKHVATQTHIDSPKAFWENDSLTLKSHAEGGDHDLGDTVAWVGKGWDQDGTNQYQFTVPDDPALSFIGEAGKTYYMAPHSVKGSLDPVWMGFGADTELPVDTFRDNIASLDLLSVDGPGEVEMFNYRSGPGGLHRFFGSHDGAPHSAWLTSGTHTHNYTVFTKPGRYELTYRTTARGKDGKFIASKPVTTSIQVGGQRPLDQPTPSLRERFDNAAAGDASSKDYQLSIMPKKQKDKDGDENLSTIEFSGGSNGTLTLLIDGYFLTDLPVKDGKAHFDEFLGPEDSSIQAVYTPEDGSPRWISEELGYSAGAQMSTTSQKSAETWTETSNPRELSSGQEDSVSDAGITARAVPEGTDATRIIVEAADKKLTGFVGGGFYNGESPNPDIDFDGAIINGRAEFVVGADNIYDGESIRVNILPHPTVVQGGTKVSLTDSFTFGTEYKGTGELGSVATEPGDNPGPGDKPGSNDTPKPKPGTNTGLCTTKKVLDHGHVDITATREGDSFTTRLKDETAIIDKKTVERPLDDVVLAVHDNALRSRPAALKGKEFDYLGQDKFFLLPQTQEQSIIWPGYNTQALNYKDYKDGTVTLNIKPVEMPEGAAVGLFTTEGMGNKFTPLVNSTQEDYSIETTFASHTHTNWAFTKPGIYKLEVTYSATTTDDKEISSKPQTLTVAAGDTAITDCTSAEEDNPGGGSQKPGDQKPGEKKPEGGKDKTSSMPKLEGLWGLVLPVVLAIVFQGFLNFYNDHRDQIAARFNGLLPR